MMTVQLNAGEIDLICEALVMRASRHDSMAMANPRNAGPHERKAAAMRKLAVRFGKVSANEHLQA